MKWESNPQPRENTAAHLPTELPGAPQVCKLKARELLQIRFNRPDGAVRDYPVRRLVDSAKVQTVELSNGEKLSVAQYFVREYKTKVHCFEIMFLD